MNIRQRRAAEAVMEDVARSVMDLERPALLRVIPVLTQAHRELEADLLRWLFQQDGEKRFTAQQYRNALRQTKRAMLTIAQLEPEMTAGLRETATSAGSLSMNNLSTELQRFGAIFEGSIHPVALDAAAVIAKADRILIPRFRSSAKRYAGDVRDDIVRELAVGRVKGETFHQTSRRLQKRIPLLRQKHTYWSERLARTEGMNAYNTIHMDGIAEAHEDDDELMVRWDSAADFRRCPQCRSLDGAIIDVGGEFEARWGEKRANGTIRIHRTTHKQPPAHPNCRCVATPWKMAWGVITRKSPQRIAVPHGVAPEKLVAGTVINQASHVASRLPYIEVEVGTL